MHVPPHSPLSPSGTSLWTRRSILKGSLIGLCFLCRQLAWPRGVQAESLPEGRLTLYNQHTDERLTVTYRSPSGDYDSEALSDLNWILRCHYTNQVTPIDLRVIEYLNAVEKRLGVGREVHIISGFRSREYNELLIQRGGGVAKESLHLSGKAVDIQIPGIPAAVVRQAALDLQYGGVGYYPKSDFVHLDSGRFRWW